MKNMLMVPIYQFPAELHWISSKWNSQSYLISSISFDESYRDIWEPLLSRRAALFVNWLRLSSRDPCCTAQGSSYWASDGPHPPTFILPTCVHFSLQRWLPCRLCAYRRTDMDAAFKGAHFFVVYCTLYEGFCAELIESMWLLLNTNTIYSNKSHSLLWKICQAYNLP